MDIEGSSAIVTGGGSGLGEALAHRLGTLGANVVVLDRQAQSAERVANEIGGHAAVADVADETQVRDAVELAQSLGPLRILANCAGISRASRTVGRDGEPFDLAKFEFVLRVNLVGTFNCLRICAAAMGENKPQEDGARGSILNTASVAAFDGQIGQAAYSASKAGIVGMTLPIARDLAAQGVRVNTIAPGLFETPIYGSGPEADAFKSKLGEGVVFPARLGYAHEFASMAAEVLLNPYMNGETIRLDGAIRLPYR